jgi:hypothetical protein
MHTNHKGGRPPKGVIHVPAPKPPPVFATKGANKKLGQRGNNTRPSTYFTPLLKQRYLEELARTGLKTNSARKLGISYGNVCLHIRKDAAFAQAVEEAMDQFRDSIEEAIDQRGRLGWDEPIYYQGTLVGHVKRYDTQLLLAQAKAHIPAYRDKAQSIQIQQNNVSLGLESLNADDRQVLREVLLRRQQPSVVDVEQLPPAAASEEGVDGEG